MWLRQIQSEYISHASSIDGGQWRLPQTDDTRLCVILMRLGDISMSFASVDLP